MDETISVGIDIGATKAQLGYRKDHRFRPHPRAARGERRTLHRNAVSCRGTVNGCEPSDTKDIAFYGVGVPGTVDTKTGLVEYCPNLGWEDVPAGAIFKHYLGAEVLVAQGSRLAA
jgi:predicted NBD/HSP70 family sugar kinase